MPTGWNCSACPTPCATDRRPRRRARGTRRPGEAADRPYCYPKKADFEPGRKDTSDLGAKPWKKTDCGKKCLCQGRRRRRLHCDGRRGGGRPLLAELLNDEEEYR